MSGITTHVLDLASGRPAAGVALELARGDGDGGWRTLAEGRTDEDGRAGPLLPEGVRATAGVHRLRFEVEEYFAQRGERAFYPYVDIVFRLREPEAHHHVPLLVAPWGYTTYRGS